MPGCTPQFPHQSTCIYEPQLFSCILERHGRTRNFYGRLKEGRKYCHFACFQIRNNENETTPFCSLSDETRMMQLKCPWTRIQISEGEKDNFLNAHDFHAADRRRDFRLPSAPSSNPRVFNLKRPARTCRVPDPFCS